MAIFKFGNLIGILVTLAGGVLELENLHQNFHMQLDKFVLILFEVAILEFVGGRLALV